MAKQFWTIGGSYGYAGTAWSEDVDALDYYTEEELAAASDEDVAAVLMETAFEHMCERLDYYAKPLENQDG